jgi:pimeloyl-ACP methyl ester carboxylesterase
VRAVVGLGIKAVSSEEDLARAAASAQWPGRCCHTAPTRSPGTWPGWPGWGGLVAAAPVLVVLARGDRDPMVSAAQPAALVPDPRVLPCPGHNAHVEDPAALLPLIDRA